MNSLRTRAIELLIAHSRWLAAFGLVYESGRFRTDHSIMLGFSIQRRLSAVFLHLVRWSRYTDTSGPNTNDQGA